MACGFTKRTVCSEESYKSIKGISEAMNPEQPIPDSIPIDSLQPPPLPPKTRSKSALRSTDSRLDDSIYKSIIHKMSGNRTNTYSIESNSRDERENSLRKAVSLPKLTIGELRTFHPKYLRRRELRNSIKAAVSLPKIIINEDESFPTEYQLRIPCYQKSQGFKPGEHGGQAFGKIAEFTSPEEQPIFTTKAHVFHIDPKTKRSWVPASSQAVNVSFFFDSTRNLYRIISVEGSKAVINSTITPNMTFTKTSQKFGQWSDIRANTVYGLGFASEPELNKFIEKFQEVKEATRQAAQQKAQQQTNGSASTPVTSASASPCSSRSVPTPPVPSQTPTSESGGAEDCVPIAANQIDHVVSSLPSNVNDIANTLKSSLVAHQRSQSLSGLQASKATDSPKHQTKDKTSVASLPQSTVEAQLRYENDRLKLALAQSSANAKKWEVELQTLKSNNARLTGALQESTANVEEWKRQLQALKEENTKMKSRVLELEASHGNPEAIAELRKEIGTLRSKKETLEEQVNNKDNELEQMRKRVDDSQQGQSASQKVEDKLKVLLADNEGLRSSVSRLQEQLDTTKSSNKAKKGALEQLNQRLAQKIQELKDIQHEISNLLNS